MTDAITLLTADHRTVDGLFTQVDGQAPPDQDVVDHIVDQAANLTKLTGPELAELGDQLAAAKASAPTRPHPHAPSEGLGTKVAGAMSAPLDKLKDAAQDR